MILPGWPTMLDVLVQIEELPASRTGRVELGSPSVGAIDIDAGCVVWISATCLRHRLRDLLAARTRLPAHEVEAVLSHCQAVHRSPFDTLLSEGWITRGWLDAVVRQYSVESLVALCGMDAAPRWVEPRLTMAPRSRLSAIDLLLEATSQLAGPRVDAAARELDAIAPGVRAAAFAPIGGELYPIAASGPVSVRDLRELAAWVRPVAQASHELGAASFALASTAGGDAVAVRWVRSLVIAEICDDRARQPEVAARCLQA